MATQNLLWRSYRLLVPLFRTSFNITSRKQVVMYSQKTPSKKETEEDVDFDKPVQFTNSKAAEYDSYQIRLKQGRTNRPSTEPLVVQISLIVFMLYFCVLREESDWDASIGEDLFTKVPDLEIVMLRNKMKQASNHGTGIFTETDRLRLEELERQQQKE